LRKQHEFFNWRADAHPCEIYKNKSEQLYLGAEAMLGDVPDAYSVDW
jgi:hypothetical protein